MATQITEITTNFLFMDITPALTSLAQWFFESLGIDFSGLEVHTHDAENHIYTIKISTTDSPLLIGPHGRTLEETQSLLIQMAEKITSTHCIIHLEINDYLAEKQKRLFSIVDRKVELARKNGIDQVIYELSGYERKQVHAYISETYPDIVTKSLDGEKWRELHIMLKEGVAPLWDTQTRTTHTSRSSDTTADLAALDLEGTNI
jgi:predicted RNA-binding protein Jag